MRLREIAATPHPFGNRIDLSWVNPDPAQYPGVRVVRRENTHPTSPYDGLVVAEGLELLHNLNDAGEAVYRVEDEGLQGETVYYYALFPYPAETEPPDYQVDIHNRTAAMASAAYNMAGQMYDLLPAVYHRYDAAPPSFEADPGPAPGHLRPFLDLPGGQLDLLYSFARAALNLYDIDRVDGRLLPLLARWIGWDTNFRLEIANQRNEIRSAPSVYKTIGIIPTVEATVKRMLGWESRAKEFVHNVFRSNAPERLNIWTRRRGSAGEWSASTRPLSLDFAYEGRPAAVYDEDGVLWLFYHTMRNDRWNVWHKTLTTFSISSDLQADLDNGIVTAALGLAFGDAGFPISWDATIEGEGGEWLVTDTSSDETYAVRSEEGQLNVYRWTPSQRLNSDETVDKRPYAVFHGSTLYVFWESYDPKSQTWRIKYRTRSGGQWSATALFGGDEVDRRSPALLLDHTDSLWAFWLEKAGWRWQLKYQRRGGDAWDLDTALTFPLDNVDDPRVGGDLFVLFQPPESTPDATARIWVFWTRKAPVGADNQTRWQMAYRIATGVDPSELTWIHSWGPDYPGHLTVDFTAIPIDVQYRTWHINRPLDWGPVYTLPETEQPYEVREPAAFFNAAGNMELFWSSSSDGSWSVWRSALLGIGPPSWEAPEQVTTGPYSQRGPLPMSIASGALLFYGSNESVGYASDVYRATETRDVRYAGATTVEVRNLAKRALRERYEDFQTYVYDTGQNGVRTDRNWYARDTVGIYLDAETEDQQAIGRNRNLINNVLRQFLPIQVRIVLIITIITRELVYTYDLSDEGPPRLIEERVFDNLDSFTSDLYEGLSDEHQDVMAGWVWAYAWSETYPNHTSVDFTNVPINTNFRSWHVGLEPGG